MSSKRIVFATFGSLGDLHPYVAIGHELVRRGHRPLIASFEEYRAAVVEAGIEFAPMRPAMSAFGERTAMMEQLFDPWRGPELMVRGIFIPHVHESYQDLARACRGADVLVTHPLAFAGPLLAQREGVRWISTARNRARHSAAAHSATASAPPAILMRSMLVPASLVPAAMSLSRTV